MIKNGEVEMNMKLTAALAAFAAVVCAATTVQARPHEFGRPFFGYLEQPRVERHSYQQRRRARRQRSSRRRSTGSRNRSYQVSASRSSGRYNAGRRPGRWCGWYMRTRRGGGPEFNVAWNWRKYGRPSGPQIGAVVVWRHHVGEIVGRTANGRWIVHSGNDGGRVRTRARSVKGAVFRMG